VAGARRILLAQTSFLGDVVLSTSLAQALARTDPEGEVWWLVRAGLAPVVAPLVGVDRVLVLDKRGADRGVAGLLASARRIRRLGFDAAVAAQRSVRTGLLLALARIPLRVGYAGSPGSPFYTRRVARGGAHARDRLLALAEPFGGAGPPPAPTLRVDEAAAARVAARLEAEGIGAGESLLALAPGSAWPTKRWPAESFAAAAERLIPGRAERAVIVGGAAEASLGAAILSRLGRERVLDWTGTTGVADLMALLARASLVLANDSGPAHVAAALGRPVVAVFGPTVPEQGFAPLGRWVRVVGRSLECRPCSRHGGSRCPLGTHACMRGLASEAVVGASLELLAEAGHTRGGLRA